MLSDFQACLDAFADQRQLSWRPGAEPSLAILELDGFPINLAYREDRGLLFIQAGVGMPPEDVDRREAFWKRLLKANNAFSETEGATLGYEEEADLVTLQVAWPLAGLTQEGFGNLLENVVFMVAHWLQELAVDGTDANHAGASEEKDGTTSFAMLRV